MQKSNSPNYFLKYPESSPQEGDCVPFDLHKICRLCLQGLQDGSCVDLFAINHLSVSPLAMITRCASIQIYEKDGFPTTICNDCYCKLEMAYEFRNRCEASDQKLREMLNIPTGNDKSAQLLSMDETTASNKEDAIYHAMKEIFGPDVDPASIIIPPAAESLLDGGSIEQQLENTPAAPLKMKMKRQIKRKSQLDELLVKHKEKLWLESTKVKIICQKRAARKQPMLGRKRATAKENQEQQQQQQQETQPGDAENPFQCTVCQRRFNRAGNLRLHMRVHSNERQFQCEICSKLFRTSSNLHAHRKTHTDERNFPCTVCERAFRTARELVSHGKTHSDVKGYVCRVCSKGFVKQSYLNTHMNTVHVGLKRYRCQECGKQFSNSSNLIAHRRVHTGEKPYKCGECDGKFNQSSALTRHIRQQHRPKEPSPEPPAPEQPVGRESEEPEELSIEVDENRSLDSAASSELSVATSLMDSQSFSYGGMPYAQTFVPQPAPPPPQPTAAAQHFSHVSHQHHHLHATHSYGHPSHHRHNHHQQQPPIMHQPMAVSSQPATNLYPTDYLPTYHHSAALPSTHQPHYDLGGYDMCYSMPASTVLNPSVMNPQPTYIFDQ
uniref:Uncharacterized protein n=1 Tax=Anopheles gambiae TaxID=7165 RepID=A0A1S4H076_ANOGA